MSNFWKIVLLSAAMWVTVLALAYFFTVYPMVSTLVLLAAASVGASAMVVTSMGDSK